MSERKDYEEQNKQEEQAAQQEEYYWHVLMEFHAMLKVFGQTRIIADLKKIKDEVDGVVEKPRIIIPGD